MSGKPNKINRFWRELKRRNVVRVFTVYAAAAFMILEFVDIVGEPLGLPDWTLKLVLALLSFGFIIALIVSWIFDVTPKGVEKTKPLSEIQEAEKTVHPGFWKIATYASVVIIIGLISFNIIGRNKISPKLELYGKSIAVLPFINDSQNDEDEMFINGTMESILNNLCKIKDLRVISRSSVEQYRDAIVPIPEIARAMTAAYILEGSMQKIGQRIRLTVQLIDQNDRHVWSEQYDREIEQLEDLFSLQSEIAELVAREIGVLITPEELQRIEKVPATDPMVVQLCQEAFSDFIEYRTTWNPEYLESATRLYGQAMAMDSTYPNAITGLGRLYQMKNYWREDRSEEGYLDSVKIYIDRALSYDNENEDAYQLQGLYYWFKRDWTASEKNFNKVLEINPNNATAYEFIGNIYMNIRGDFVKAIQYYEEAEKRNKGVVIANFYRWFGHAYMGTGFFDLAEEYLRKALVFDGDTSVFYSAMANLEHQKGNFKKASELGVRAYSINPRIGYIGVWDFIYSDQIEEANKWEKLFEENMPGEASMSMGYLSLINGDREKAEQQFNEIMKGFQEDAKRSPDWIAEGYSHVNVAAICAWRGQKDEAYMYLDDLLRIKKSLRPADIIYLEITPLFDSIREEDRFQRILRKARADNQAAHERMRLYLEETGRL